jgi:hypothetical protein
MDKTKLSTQADALRDRISQRTGIHPSALQCPRERSDMTPCVARDGVLAVYLSTGRYECCVGCERTVQSLLDEEGQRATP